MERPPISPNAPTFNLPTFSFDIEENAEIGSFVGFTEAIDGDGDKLWYHIIGKSEEETFS